MIVQHLSATATTCDGKVSKIVKPSLSITCYLNFHEDFVKFEFLVANDKLKDLSIKKKTICYEKILEKIDSQTFRKHARELTIIKDELTRDSNNTTVDVRASIKDVLLNLFSHHRKEFRLTVDYTMGLPDTNKYQTTFSVLIPNITQK